MASELLYKMIIEKAGAGRDQDHINLLIVSDASIPDRTEVILSGDEAKCRELEMQLSEDIKIFESTSCIGFCAACNTVHYFLDRIENSLSVPLIHMIRESSDYIVQHFKGGKIALLATDGTIKTRLYQNELEKNGIEIYLLSRENQAVLMYEIYDRIKAGKRTDNVAWESIDAELREAGVSAALLACTELSLIKREERLSDFYLDSMEILAESVLEFARKEKP